jgi:diketogulonate reductase-like aldo/keto reductase
MVRVTSSDACLSLKSRQIISNWLDNEKEVGLGIKTSGVARSDIFLTTKLDNIDHKDVLGALNKSLELLGTEYVDLCE